MPVAGSVEERLERLEAENRELREQLRSLPGRPRMHLIVWAWLVILTAYTFTPVPCPVPRVVQFDKITLKGGPDSEVVIDDRGITLHPAPDHSGSFTMERVEGKWMCVVRADNVETLRRLCESLDRVLREGNRPAP